MIDFFIVLCTSFGDHSSMLNTAGALKYSLMDDRTQNSIITIFDCVMGPIFDYYILAVPDGFILSCTFVNGDKYIPIIQKYDIYGNFISQELLEIGNTVSSCLMISENSEVRKLLVQNKNGGWRLLIQNK